MPTNSEGARSNPVANFARERKKRREKLSQFGIEKQKNEGTPTNDQRRASALEIFGRLYPKLLSVNKRLDTKDV